MCMPRRRIPVWQPLSAQSQSWQCLSPSARVTYLTRKLRAKHGLRIVCQFGQDRFFHSPDLSGYCPWEQALLNQEALWSVQTKFFDFVQWLKDTFITDSEKLVSAEQETWVEVLRRIGEDKELSAHLVEEGLSTHSCLKKEKYASVC